MSTVIACYNHGQFVDGAVDSVLNQSFRDTEIIIVNDGSTDEYTNRLLAEYRKPKTRVVHTENRGPAAARNTGVREASGEYILNLDADDRFRPAFLEKAVHILDTRPEVGIVGCWAQTYGDFRYVIKYRGGTAVDALNGMGCAAGSLYRRLCWEEVGGYDSSFEHNEDWDFYLSITTRGWVVEAIPEILFDYRKSRGSRVFRKAAKRPFHESFLVRKHLDLYREHVVEALEQKNTEIARHVHLIESIYASPRYKIGGLFTVPFQRLWRVARKLAGKQEEESY